MEAVDRKTVSTIRALCADTVEKANSGHPGLPFGLSGGGLYLMGKGHEASWNTSEVGTAGGIIFLSCREDMDHHCFIVCFIYMTMD